MAKKKTAFVCNECGADFPKWQGQCPACGAWNTLQEFVVDPAMPKSRSAERSGFSGQLSEVRQLNEIALEDSPRISAGMDELDRVLGGGLVPGSAILLGGHPGAGKSTLLLQVLCRLADREKCFYITGEESLAQVAMRADRLKLPKEKLRLAAETDVEQILELARKEQPRLLVVDSIQVMYLAGLQSAPGSVAQVREGAAALTRFAKQTGTVLLLVGHVTKDGTLAGPKVLEHMIDASLLLEGDGDSRFRTLRGQLARSPLGVRLGVGQASALALPQGPRDEGSADQQDQHGRDGSRGPRRVTLRPTQHPRHGGRRAGLDGLMLPHSPQLLRQIFGGLVAAVPVLVHGGRDHDLQIRRDRRVDAARRGWLLRQDGLIQGLPRGHLEGTLQGQALVEQHAERVDVGAPIHRDPIGRQLLR